jgi:hypothetical protein
MSYSGRMIAVTCDAKIRAIDVGKAQRILNRRGFRIEFCFLGYMSGEADKLIDEDHSSAMVDVPKDRCFFSGHSVDPAMLEPIASLIRGTLSGYFVGEDGSLYGGFLIQDGVFVECDVGVTLTPKAAPKRQDR